jgi:predicted O-linked N-acetylglucosamine transferase (SPINDLY family)
MASGALVAGYASMGQESPLIGDGPGQNCLLAPIGDYISLARSLAPLLTEMAAGEMGQWNSILSNGINTVSDLTVEAEEKALIQFWRNIHSNPSKLNVADGVRTDMICPNADSPNSPCMDQLSGFNGMENELTAEELFRMAYWFDESRMPGKAIEFYGKAIDADPGFSAAHHNLAVLCLERDQKAEAIHHLQQAIRYNPGLADSYSALGMIHFGENRFEQALELLEQAVAANPSFAEAHFNMGIVFQQIGAYERCKAAFRKASACNPGFAPARWLSKLCLPMLYMKEEEIGIIRERFSENLDSLIQSIPLDSPDQVDQAYNGIRSATNFYLQYQGHNDLELQLKYGKWVHRIMSLRYPQWTSRLCNPPPRPGEKIRIGYISAFMNRHTVGTFLAGWVEHHNPDAFDVHCYHLGRKSDDLTQHLRRHSHRFHHIPGNIEAAASQIASDKLNILVYNEIGMDVDAMMLAALRLAPVQCVGWGHPVTSGLPTIDYFLSSELMEPENADHHYSEQLVRLPNLSLCYHPPKLPEEPLSRETLGIPSDRFIFLSSQSIYKYLPQHDTMYPMIAKKAPNACFVFISHRNPHVTQLLKSRLRSAFERYHLDFDHFCHFSRRLNAVEFMSLNMAADAFLDTLGWSGGKTTLEAISAGLPVVTSPGRFMRGRHAFAMLIRMGIKETIAQDMDAYCAIAAHLANDKAFYRSVKKQFSDHRHKLYDDTAFIAELENQYRSMVQADPSETADTNESAERWFQSANMAFKQMDYYAAIPCYEKAIAKKPDWDAAHYNLAVALHMAKDVQRAIDHASSAIQINPEYANAYPLLFRLAQHACDWPLAEKTAQQLDEITRSQLIHGVKTTEPPITNIRRCSDVETNFKVSRSWSRHISQLSSELSPNMIRKDKQTDQQRIRVGYLSSDFKDHAVAYQVKGLLEKHNRKQFVILGYACNPDNGSPYRRKLALSCDQFRDVHDRSNRFIAEQIRKDGIHILVDMSGHSKGNRLGIAALRPAPIQVSYLGFLSTTGADFIDYVLADAVVVPEAHQRFYTEKVVYLPHCYQANDDQLTIAAEKQVRRQWHLPDDAFVYCSFNQPYKIDVRLFRVWMRILKRVDRAVLWLVERSALARQNLQRSAEKAGVDPKRLIFTGFVPMDQNLARLSLADLMLDTVGYNGGATSSNALWAGVPVLTKLGDHWVSRMSASALRCLGLDELIAADLDAYEQIAVELAANGERLDSIRHRLHHQRTASPLFNTELFARHVESAYQGMWNRFASGLPAASFCVEP